MNGSATQHDVDVILSVENLWVRKGGLRGYKWILRSVYFDVRKGEFVAVIGPNGAGKTKMLEAITGDRPYAGRVSMRGQDLYATPEYWLRRIGWVPSYNVLHDSLRVREALLQIGKLRLPGRPERAIKARIEALLDELEFAHDRRGALVRELSSGQRKRLDLCAELLTNPPLMLLDEPTTNLDPDAERSLMELLSRRAHEDGQAVLIVTHTLQSLYFCDRVLFLANGRLRAEGRYDQVLEQLEFELGAESFGGLPEVNDLVQRGYDQAAAPPPASTLQPLSPTPFDPGEPPDAGLTQRDSLPGDPAQPPFSGAASAPQPSPLEPPLPQPAPAESLPSQPAHPESPAIQPPVPDSTPDRPLLQAIPPQAENSAEGSVDDASRWAAIYRKTRAYDAEPLGKPPPETPPPRQGRFRLKPSDWVHELRVLLKRNWLLFKNNLPALGLYLMLGPFSGFLSRIVLRDNAFVQNEDLFGYSTVFDTSDARQAVFIIALVVTLLGLIGSFLDVTRERPIYRYERVKGLSPWAYVLSKWIMLSGMVGILAPTFLVFVLTFRGQPMPSQNLVMLTLYLACIASVSLGLAISAASSSERTATGLLGIVVVFNLFFSGGVDFNERFQPFLERISVLAPSHWAAEGVSTSIQLYCWASNPRFQDFYSWGHLFSVWLYLVVFMLLAFALAFVALRLQETWFSKRDRLLKSVFNEHMLLLAPLVIISFSWAAFFKARSLDYFHLRAEEDSVRVENAVYRNLFQTYTGYMSQSLCPVPTPLPPPATPMVAAMPTLAPTPTSPLAAAPTQTPVIEMPAAETPVVDASLSATEPGGTPDAGIAPLPVGTLVSDTPILFGPEHASYPLENLPAGTNFTLLGKDTSEAWFRVKETHTGRQLIGWVPVGSTNLPASQTGQVPDPPACAAPRAYIQGEGLTPAVEWRSDVSGHVVAVIDLFRDEAGVETRPTQLLAELNGQVLDSYPVKPTRQAFIFRGLAVDVQVSTDDQVKFFIEIPLTDRRLYLRASVFFVPPGCSF